MKPNLNTSDIWHAWIVPIMAALVVGAVLIVERLQVDWSVSCAILGRGACATSPFGEIFGWLPVPLTFGALHIWGARRLFDAPLTTAAIMRRLLAIGLFLAMHLLPVPGLFLFYVGLGGGLIITLTVVGVVVAPVVGVLAAGFCAGLAMGVLAGPAFTSMPWRRWRTFLWRYGLGGALGAAALAFGQIMFDPAFANALGINQPWLTALGTLATVLAVGAVTSWFAWRGWERAGLLAPVVQPVIATYRIPAALAVVLIVPVHLMVTHELTIFRRDGAPVPAVAELFRGYKPGIRTELTFAGLTYVGPRALILRRAMMTRQRIETTRIDRGAAGWSNVGTTVMDRFDQWELSDPSSAEAKRIFVTADRSALEVTYECQPGRVAEQEFCSRRDAGTSQHQNKTFAVASEKDAYLRSPAAPDAALGLRLVLRDIVGDNKREWERLYCRLNLTSVTSAKLSVLQVVPCDADWVALARTLRTRLERDFVAK